MSGAGESLDYATLWRRARAVGRALRQRGVGPETRIGLCMQRTPDLIVGLLGILEAHAAYVPLDPQLPEARLRMLLDDSRLSLVLTHEPTAERVERIAPRAGVLLSECEAAGGDEPDTEYADEAMPPAGLAYVIYTSGSTGRPKGVSITRGGLLHLARAQIVAFGIVAESRVCQFASIGFDASVSEMFTSLLSGACLVMAEDVQEPERLMRWLETEAVSHATLPPALLQLLPGDGLPVLGTLVSAGERCSWEIVRSWSAGRRLINAYGPTEVTVCASWGEVAEWSSPWARVPIGEALEGAELYVLDDGMMPVVRGGSGELYVGGAGLARGYLGRSGASAERFVPHPWREGARLYRTGDRVRERPDGWLEYLGRRDEQVKIRGVRVEPGELEATLAGLSGVSAAAVVVVGTAEGSALDAYVVGEAEPAWLRQQLRERLPGYLQPREVHRLEALPRTANGKVDRRRLEPVEIGPAEAKGGPASEIEAQLCRCMEAVLGRGAVGVEDSFFDLGGNSLSAVRLTTAIREQLKLQIQVRDVFMFPSPAMLAKRVEDGGDLPAGALVPLNHGARDGGGRVYCAHTLSGEVGIYRRLASGLACRVHGLRDEGDTVAPEQETLEARGRAFARTILNEGRGDGPTVILGWSFGACVALETARALRQAGAPAELVLIEPAALDAVTSGNTEQAVLTLFMHEWQSAFDSAAQRDLPTAPSTLEELYRLALDHGVLPGTIQLSTLREHFSRFRRNLNALWHYRPLDYDGPGRVIWSENAENANHRSVWNTILANVKHEIAPGTHRSVMTNPGLARIESLVRKCLISPIDGQSSFNAIAKDFNLPN